MAKGVIDAEAVLNRAKPLAHQQAPEIQPYGHLVKLPIALAESGCRESVDNLNQLLADTSHYGTSTRSTTGRWQDRRFISCTCS